MVLVLIKWRISMEKLVPIKIECFGPKVQQKGLIRVIKSMATYMYNRLFGHETHICDAKGNSKLIDFECPELGIYNFYKAKENSIYCMGVPWLAIGSITIFSKMAYNLRLLISIPDGENLDKITKVKIAKGKIISSVTLDNKSPFFPETELNTMKDLHKELITTYEPIKGKIMENVEKMAFIIMDNIINKITKIDNPE